MYRYHGPQISIYGPDGDEAAVRVIRQALPRYAVASDAEE
jgi:hypothetical protein